MGRKLPPYSVFLSEPPFALRDYAETLAATVTVSGPRQAAVRAAMGPLLAYFAGYGQRGRTLLQVSPASPALHTPFSILPEICWTVRMLLPPGARECEVGIPSDPRVTLEAWPACRIAVLDTRGEPETCALPRSLAELHGFLHRVGLVAEGDPVYACPGPRWMPRTWRRLAIMQKVRGG